MTNAIPVREGLFRETDHGPTLLAARCELCGRTVFPATEQCLECGHHGVQTVELGGRGELLCATVVHMSNGRFEAGYSVGYVTMPHGIRVFTPIETDREEPLPCGTQMQLEIVPLWRDNDHDVLAHRFVPVAREERANA